MKIGILAYPLDDQYAGIHVYTRALVKGLIRNFPQHEFVLIRSKTDGQFSNAKQIAIPNRAFIPGFSAFRLFVLAPRILRKEKVDVVIEAAHFGPFNLPKSIKRVTVIHDLTPIKFPKYHRWVSQTLQKIFLPFILRKTDLVVTNSKYTSKDLEETYPFTKTKNVPILLGNSDFYKPINSSKAIKELGVENPFLLFVGTIEPRKNLGILLRAYEALLDESDVNLDLVIVGKLGWKTESFEQKLARHKYKARIKRLGYVEKKILPELYSNCKCFIFPSLYEGFGIPVLEALACGSPVISSDRSSLPEVGGSCAVYFNPESSDELKAKILDVLQLGENEKEELKAKSQSWAASFSWDNYAKDFMGAVQSIK